jgi:hypothetical protein
MSLDRRYLSPKPFSILISILGVTASFPLPSVAERTTNLK